MKKYLKMYKNGDTVTLPEVTIRNAYKKINRKTPGFEPINERTDHNNSNGGSNVYFNYNNRLYYLTDDDGNIIGTTSDPRARNVGFNSFDDYNGGSEEDLKTSQNAYGIDRVNMNQTNQLAKQADVKNTKELVNDIHDARTNFVRGALEMTNAPNNAVMGAVRAMLPSTINGGYTWKDYKDSVSPYNLHKDNIMRTTGVGDVFDVQNPYLRFGLNILNPELVAGVGPDIYNGVKNATRPNINFIRNLGDVPDVNNNAFWASPKDNALTNMTWPTSFRTHKRYRSRPGEHYIVMPNELFRGQKFLSTDPMDTFLRNTELPANKSYFISGNKEARDLARSRGFNIVEDSKLDDLWQSVLDANANANNSSGIKLNSIYRGSNIENYDSYANQLIQNKFGKPSVLDGLKLWLKTGINPHLSFSPKLKYDPATTIESKLSKKYGFDVHPKINEDNVTGINNAYENLKPKAY